MRETPASAHHGGKHYGSESNFEHFQLSTAVDAASILAIPCTGARHGGTVGYGMQPVNKTSGGAIELDGVTYHSAADVQRDLGVARQTLWRWRRAKKIPQGRRYRDGQVLFTSDEVEAIRSYAHRLVPVDVSVDQLKLFNARKRRVG